MASARVSWLLRASVRGGLRTVGAVRGAPCGAVRVAGVGAPTRSLSILSRLFAPKEGTSSREDEGDTEYLGEEEEKELSERLRGEVEARESTPLTLASALQALDDHRAMEAKQLAKRQDLSLAEIVNGANVAGESD